MPVQHSIDILEHSLQKLDANNTSDKRYRFDATLIRAWSTDNLTSDNLSFVVVWNGRQNYVSITEINGRLSSISEMDAEQLYALAADLLKKGNKAQGMSLLKQAANESNIHAINLLGKQYFTSRQYSDAYKWLIKGNSTSGEVCYMLAWMYENGQGTTKDWWKALDYYEKAIKDKYYLAEQGYRKLENKMIASNMINSGKVVNEQGKGINSAAINVQGTDAYFLTDLYGDFTIKGLKKGDMLVFSNLGYETKVIPWSTNISKTITLKRKPQNTYGQQSTTQSPSKDNQVAAYNTHGVCKGKVTDIRGNAINMATVSVEGTNITVLTDYWGEYTISGLRPGDNIVFTNPGCQTQKFKWSGKNLNVTLQSTTQRGNSTVKGKILDSKGNGVNGAIVAIEGTNIKGLTNLWGEYELKGLNLGDIIVVSNYGYQTQKKKFNTSVIDFTLLKEGENTQRPSANRTSSSTSGNKPATNGTTTPKRTIYTHTGKLTGYVIDRKTKKGINCALVQIQGTDIKVLTDLYGAFTLKGLKNGDKIIITNLGYRAGSHIWYKSREKSIWNLNLEKE